MARIVLVGTPAEAGLRVSLATALRTCGNEVDMFDLGPWSPGWLVSAAYRRPILGSGLRREFRRRIDALADKAHTELVIVLKGELLNSRSIDHLRKRFDSAVVCWNPDSPFDQAISNRGAGIPRAIGAYDAYVTWADDVAERLDRIAARVLVIPFGWDPEIMRPVAGDGIAANRIVFIGTATKQRAALMQSLAHLHPLVFGSRWPNLQGIEVRPAVFGNNFCKVTGEAKWNINVLRPQNAKSHNMRTFEIVGAGGNQVAPQTHDHRKFLISDSRTALFRKEVELESILRSDPRERPSRQPGLLEGQTYVDRVNQLLRDMYLI
jgi:hypothetical protein